MGRQPCCDKLGVKRGPWTAEEDRKLISFILSNGHCCWRAVPKLAGLLRCGKSCRLRWTNYLRPDLKRGLLTDAEELVVIDLHAKLGNRYACIHTCIRLSIDASIHLQFYTEEVHFPAGQYTHKKNSTILVITVGARNTYYICLGSTSLHYATYINYN